MTGFDKKKSHKKLSDHEIRIKELEDARDWEKLLRAWTIICVGAIGLLACIFIDPIRERPQELGWLQLTGLILSMVTVVAGTAMQSKMEKEKEE